MGDIRWYKRDPDAALAGMAMLTLEECGAYNLVLDLIYSREGNLPDDERTIARWIRCDVRVWRRIRSRLIELGKLYTHGGKLRNARSDKEMFAAQHLISSRANRSLEVKKKSNKNKAKIHYTYNQIVK